MNCNTNITYINTNSDTCTPLPIIETTESNIDNLPVENAIYNNLSGFDAITVSTNGMTIITHTVEQRVSKKENGGVMMYQYASTLSGDVAPITYIRCRYKLPTSTTYYGSSWSKYCENGSIIAQKLGTASNVGSPTQPMYLLGGMPYESNATVGSSTTPVYLNSGTITPCAGENLIMNPDFTINQRAQSKYSTTLSIPVYTADRWVFSATASTHQFNPNTGSGATFTKDTLSATTNCTLYQYIEKDLDLNTVYTITLSTNLGTFISKHTTPTTLPTSTTKYNIYSIISDDVTYGYVSIGYNSSKASWFVHIEVVRDYMTNLSLYYIKLEKGSTATPYITPDPVMELLKCQRYFFKKVGQISAVAANTDSLFPNIVLPTILRKAPTLTVKTSYSVRGAGVSTTADSTNISIANPEAELTCSIDIKVTGTFTKYQAYSMHNGVLWFDAEL